MGRCCAGAGRGETAGRGCGTDGRNCGGAEGGADGGADGGAEAVGGVGFFTGRTVS